MRSKKEPSKDKQILIQERTHFDRFVPHAFSFRPERVYISFALTRVVRRLLYFCSGLPTAENPNGVQKFVNGVHVGYHSVSNGVYL